MANLDRRLSGEEKVQETQQPKQEIPEIKFAEVTVQGEAAPVVFEPNQKLLELMDPFLVREIASALSQDSIFTGQLPPTAVFNFHRSLSTRSESIPWECLRGLSLATYEDSHPRIGPGGALLMAIFLNPRVRNRAMAVCRGEVKSIRTVGVHLSHLLTLLSGGRDLSGKETTYIKNCQGDLRSASLFCVCEDCRVK